MTFNSLQVGFMCLINEWLLIQNDKWKLKKAEVLYSIALVNPKSKYHKYA